MKFSIIIPVYNVEEYLEECVNSVLRQTFTDFEIVLVDDGSTDSSVSICDKLAELDCVSCYHVENGGAASARNYGMTVAKGDYFIFMDSDDYWSDKNALSQIADSIEKNKSDIVVFGCTDFDMVSGKSFVSRNNYDLKLISESTNDEVLHYFMSNKLLPGGPTIFAFDAGIVSENGISFKTGIQDEDYDFVLSVFLESEKLSAINNPFYMYRKGRSGSVTKASGIKMIYGIDYTVQKWSKLADSIENETVRADVLNYLAYIFCTGLVIMGRMDKPLRKKAGEIMDKNSFILKYAQWKRPKTIAMLLRFISIERLSRIISRYYDMSRF
ncbi:MAG: glycosyltransferase [Eubacterium sp.]|nr:glycosyltransferase [Eubacterium sp.]